MRIENVPLNKLVPIERYLNGANLCFLFRTLDLSNIPPCLGIKYEDKFILGDGHHRARVAAFVEKKDLPLQILETDEDIVGCNAEAFRGYSTIDSFVNQCENHLIPLAVQSGIRTIYNYVLRRGNIMASKRVARELSKSITKAKGLKARLRF